ncbi:MAG: hypothetical protein ACO3JL_05480 [Myxococcota bacterium]
MRHARLSRVVFSSLVLCAVGCDAPEVPTTSPLAVSVALRPRASCGASPLDYQLSCLAAVVLEVSEAKGQKSHAVCTLVDENTSLESLADLLTRDVPLVKLLTMADRGPFIFRMRGVHRQGLTAEEDPCSASSASRHWLLFGESAPVSLANVTDDAVEVAIGLDCRSCQSGCGGLVEGTCPARFPASYCVPYTPGFSCARRCDGDEECFEGALPCDNETGRCDPAGAAPGGAGTGGFCGGCLSSGDCDPGFACVGARGATVGLCSESCPLQRCRNGATCLPLSADLVLLGAPAAGEAPGAPAE